MQNVAHPNLNQIPAPDVDPKFRIRAVGPNARSKVQGGSHMASRTVRNICIVNLNRKPAPDLNLSSALCIGAVGPTHRPAVEITPQGPFAKGLWALTLEIRLEEGCKGQNKRCGM